MISKVLIVCIGNICRSPMAEGLLKTVCPTLTVRSAGLSALVGKPADPYAQELMAEISIDISAHRALQLTQLTCIQSDLILVMDRVQRQEIETLYPVTRGRVYRLGEVEGFDIFDPYKMERSDFKQCFNSIDRGIRDWKNRLDKVVSA